MVRYLHDEGTEIAKGWDFWGSFQLKSSGAVELVTYALYCFVTNDKFAKMPKVLESGVDVNVAGDAYIELEAMKMIMALVLRGSSSCFSLDPLRRLHLS